MEQHSVPQNITGFQFKLVGDMTLKQFAEMAIGCLLGVFIFSLPLHDFLKYPLALSFGAAGFAFAFVPVNELPLDRWFIAFFRAIYSPTQFFWQKNNNLDDLLGFAGGVENAQLHAPKIEAHSSVYSFATKSVNPPEPVPPPISPPSPPTVSDLQKIREEKLASAPPPPKPTAPPVEEAVAQKEGEIKQAKEKDNKMFSQASDLYNLMDKAKEEHDNQKIKNIEEQISNLLRQKQELRQFAKEKKQEVSDQKIEAVKPLLNPNIDYPRYNDVLTNKPSPKKNPGLTQTPNVLSGFVWDSHKKPVSSAIIIIKDNNGNSVRALRSNQVGQFLAATPLPVGDYIIEAEKTGLQFSPQKVQLNGGIVPSIEITAHDSKSV
ncbi:MAG: PrgI family protein [Patescibacteria group bacterium]